MFLEREKREMSFYLLWIIFRWYKIIIKKKNKNTQNAKERRQISKNSHIFILYIAIIIIIILNLKYKIELDYNKLEGFLAAILKILGEFVQLIRVFTLFHFKIDLN